LPTPPLQIKDYPPEQTVISHVFTHRDLNYNFQVHRPKLDRVPLPALKDYLLRLPQIIRHDDFETAARCSQLKTEPDIAVKQTQGTQASKDALKALQFAKTNRQRHDVVENFMLNCDCYTIAAEVPVWVEIDLPQKSAKDAKRDSEYCRAGTGNALPAVFSDLRRQGFQPLPPYKIPNCRAGTGNALPATRRPAAGRSSTMPALQYFPIVGLERATPFQPPDDLRREGLQPFPPYKIPDCRAGTVEERNLPAVSIPTTARRSATVRALQLFCQTLPTNPDHPAHPAHPIKNISCILFISGYILFCPGNQRLFSATSSNRRRPSR
jgi:hypothetical protein